MGAVRARFSVGQLVHHTLYDYRGVIIDADPHFQGTDEWYDKIALTRPPRNQPWYHVLINGAIHHAYVPEQNLEVDRAGEPIDHPELTYFFEDFKDGVYIARQSKN